MQQNLAVLSIGIDFENKDPRLKGSWIAEEAGTVVGSASLHGIPERQLLVAVKVQLNLLWRL